jgi:pre-mRNA cleavage complex 2 protein Pcf11
LSDNIYHQVSQRLIFCAQLRSMVQTTAMTTADLSAIITRLRDLAKNTASTAPALPAMPPPPPLPQLAYNPSPPTINPIANVSTDAISSALSALISQPPAVAPVVAPPAQTATPPVPDVSQLFKSLVAAGLINGDGSASVPASSQPQDDSPKIEPIIEPKPASVDSKLAAMREYEKRLLSLQVSLSASGLQRYVLLSVSILLRPS